MKEGAVIPRKGVADPAEGQWGKNRQECSLKPCPLPTLGCKDLAQGQLLKELMQTPNFRITVVEEVDTVEICGALKVRGTHGRLWGGRSSPGGLA